MGENLRRFWEWMKEKEHATKSGTERWYLNMNNMLSHKWPKQMLIGYMIEYINGHRFWNRRKGEKEFESPERCMELDSDFRMAIKHRNIYKELERIIKELEK